MLTSSLAVELNHPVHKKKQLMQVIDLKPYARHSIGKVVISSGKFYNETKGGPDHG
jgi:hypothetical protein